MSTGSSFDARITLRPRSTDETFDLALAYLRRYAGDFLGPVLFVSGAVMAPVVTLFFLGVGWGPAACVAIFMLGLAERVVVVYAGRHLFANPASVWGSVRQVIRRAPASITSTFSSNLPVLLLLYGELHTGELAFAVILATFWPLAVASRLYVREVLHLEELPLHQANKRARALTTYRFGRALILLGVGALVRGLFILAVHSGILFVLGFMLQFAHVAETIGYVAALSGLALSGPYIALVRLFDYIDARTRREGWDIQVRFNAIAERARAELNPGRAA